METRTKSIDETGGVQMTFDATTSFSTLAQADSYHDARLHNSEWGTSDDATKQKALMWATRLLNAVYWAGSLKSTSQPLSFPRVGLSDKDFRSITSTEIPEFLINATAELAWLLIINDTTRASSTKGFSKIKVAVIELEIDKTDRNKSIADSVIGMISDYVSKASGAGMVHVVRG